MVNILLTFKICSENRANSVCRSNETVSMSITLFKTITMLTAIYKPFNFEQMNART